MATITVDLFDPKSIEKAVTRISVLKVALENIKDFPVKEIANVGLATAQEGFGSASTSPYYGEDPVVVSLQETENGYCICAMGEQVSFIEFGAGVYSNFSPYMGETPDWVVPWGEYGKKKGRNKQWSYIGSDGTMRTTKGIYARQGMYFALQDMKKDALAIVEHYFKNTAFKGL